MSKYYLHKAKHKNCQTSNFSKTFFYLETVRVQGARVHQAVHGPQLPQEARQDGPRGRLLRLKEA